MTEAEKELDRRFYCSIGILNTEIEVVRNDKPDNSDCNVATVAKILENARDIFLEVHEEWRKHIGDPILDTRGIIGKKLRQLADNIETGQIEL